MAVEVKGLDELKRKFAEIPKALRARVLRNALSAGARLVRNAAKRKAPLLQATANAPYRRRGTVRDAIMVRSSKADKRDGNVGVFVNVKPLPGDKFKRVVGRGFFGGKTVRRVLVKATERGAKNPFDPYYWKFLEFGTKKMAKRPFLAEGAKKLGDALTVFEKSISKWMNSIDKGGAIK